MKSLSSDDLLPAQTPQRTAAGAITPAVKDPERHQAFLRLIEQNPSADLVFLGDSITDFWPSLGAASWAHFAPYKPLNLGISGDRTENVLWRLENGELEGIRPRTVVIMIGTNNIGHDIGEKPEWAVAGVEKIVATVRQKLPQSKILLLGVFPRDAKDSPNRRAVEAINGAISKLGDGGAVQYLDIGAAFLDSDGNIPADVMPDGLHPEAKGYELWHEAMQPTLDRLMKN